MSFCFSFLTSSASTAATEFYAFKRQFTEGGKAEIPNSLISKIKNSHRSNAVCLVHGRIGRMHSCRTVLLVFPPSSLRAPPVGARSLCSLLHEYLHPPLSLPLSSVLVHPVPFLMKSCPLVRASSICAPSQRFSVLL